MRDDIKKEENQNKQKNHKIDILKQEYEQINKDYTCRTYMTTGCLLAMLVSRKSLQGFTPLIIDEVHERDEATDLLLMIVRNYMGETYCNTKVILMSATADASKFSQYFATPVSGNFVPAPIVEVVEVEVVIATAVTPCLIGCQQTAEQS